MSHCVTFTLPAYVWPGPKGPVVKPAGQVGIVRPNHRLIMALLRPTRVEAVTSAATLGINRAVAGAMWDTMREKTERGAALAIATYDIPRYCESINVDPALVTNVTYNEEVGLLHPKANRRFRDCWRGASNPTVSMPLARAQCRYEFYWPRAHWFRKSDIDLLKAEEAGDVVMVGKMKAYRQQLRDLGAVVDTELATCQTPEELEAWKPTWPIDPAPPHEEY